MESKEKITLTDSGGRIYDFDSELEAREFFYKQGFSEEQVDNMIEQAAEDEKRCIVTVDLTLEEMGELFGMTVDEVVDNMINGRPFRITSEQLLENIEKASGKSRNELAAQWRCGLN